MVYGYRGRAMGNGWLISSMSMSIFDFNIMLIGDALFIYFFIPFTIFALLALAPLPIVVTQIRDHIADSCPPPPLRFVPSIFIATRHQPFLPSSTRVEIAPTCARRSQQLILSILQISSKSHHGGIRTPVPTVAAFDGNHLTTGPTEYDIGI